MSRGLDVFRYVGPRSDLPDLTISPGWISFSTHTPTSGDVVTITARVKNAGGSEAAPVVVRFTDNGTLIGERTIASIPAGESRTTSVTWSTAGIEGDRTIAVTVDPSNLVREQVEANNAASRKLRVRAPK
jgi:subtilase family serine protease